MNGLCFIISFFLLVFPVFLFILRKWTTVPLRVSLSEFLCFAGPVYLCEYAECEYVLHRHAISNANQRRTEKQRPAQRKYR